RLFLAQTMEDGLVGRALVVAGNRGDEEIEASKLAVLEVMNLLGETRRARSTKVDGKHLHPRWRGRLVDSGEFERNRRTVSRADVEHGMQLLLECFAGKIGDWINHFATFIASLGRGVKTRMPIVGEFINDTPTYLSW